MRGTMSYFGVETCRPIDLIVDCSRVEYVRIT